MRTVVTLGLVCLLATAALGKTKTRRGERKTVAAPVEARVEDPHREAAAEALEAGNVDAFAKKIDAEAGAAVAETSDLNLERVTRLAAWREFARSYASDPKLDDARRETLRWLLDQPELFRTLMLATAEADAPAEALDVLGLLRGEYEDKLNERADLAAAFCVVWDVPPQRKGEDSEKNEDRDAADAGQSPRRDTQRVLDLYRYYTDPKSRLQVDLRPLPWELLVYVADNDVAADEIAWARKRYQRRGFTGKSYFEVPYDLGAFRGGRAQRIGGRAYTLPNLQRYGGVCYDQAYYAAHVGKSFGVPATVCNGQGGATGGGGHAWVGYLQVKGKQVAWNFSDGRYAAHLYWSGRVTDPQTGAALTDADVSLLAELSATKRPDRLASVALWKLRDLAAEDQLVDLYTHAINLSPGNRPAWISLAALGADGKLSDNESNGVADVVQRFAFARYPEFAFSVSRRLVDGRPPEVQLSALDRMAKTFAARPDLVATARIAQGDLLRAENRPDDALRAYGEVLTVHLKAGPVVLTAMQRVDEILRAEGDLKRLAGIYEKVWMNMPAPDANAFANETPYYTIGQRYAELLDTLGRGPAAKTVRAKLATVHVTGKQANRGGAGE